MRGRVEGRRVVPYWTARTTSTRGRAPVAGRELACVDDPVEAFFLQIQGSGRVALADGSVLRVATPTRTATPTARSAAS